MVLIGGCVANLNMKIVHADNVYCKMHDIEESQSTNSFIHEHVHEEDVSHFVKHIQSSSDSPSMIKYRSKSNKNKPKSIIGIVNKKEIYQKFNLITLNLSDLLLKDKKLNIEHFMNNWMHHPDKLSATCGILMGQVQGSHLSDFALNFGTNYFEKKDICNRIDFLYGCDNLRSSSDEYDTILNRAADVYKKDEIICIKSKTHRHNKCRILVLKGKDEFGLTYYSIRQYMDNKKDLTPFLLSQKHKIKCKPTFMHVLNSKEIDTCEYPDIIMEDNCIIKSCSFDSIFWGFRENKHKLEGVVAYPSAGGFTESKETKSMADLIVLVTNLLGFKRY